MKVDTGQLLHVRVRHAQEQLIAFVDGLDISDAAKDRLRRLTPGAYTGVASALVDRLPAVPARP